MVGFIVAMFEGHESKILSSQFGECLWRAAKGGHKSRDVKIPTLHKTHLSSTFFWSRLLHLFQPTEVQVFALCLRRIDILDTL